MTGVQTCALPICAKPIRDVLDGYKRDLKRLQNSLQLKQAREASLLLQEGDRLLRNPQEEAITNLVGRFQAIKHIEDVASMIQRLGMALLGVIENEEKEVRAALEKEKRERMLLLQTQSLQEKWDIEFDAIKLLIQEKKPSEAKEAIAKLYDSVNPKKPSWFSHLAIHHQMNEKISSLREKI